MFKKVTHVRNLLRLAKGKKDPIIGPVKAMWEVLYVCNAGCQTCERWKAKPDPTVLSTEEGRNLIQQLAGAGVLNLTFTGGEPLLRKDIYELIACAKAHRLSTSLYSNGLLINTRRANELINSGLDLIYLSLDGSTSALNDRLRGISGYFDLVMKAIEGLKSLRKNGHPKIFIAFTINKQNMHDLENIAKLVKMNALDGLSLQLALHAPKIMYKVDENLAFKLGDGAELQAAVDNVLENYSDFLPMNREYYQHFGDYIEHPQEVAVHQSAVGFAMAMINPWGDIYPDPLQTESMGNVRQQTFKQIWYGEQANAVRRQIANRKHPVSLVDSLISLNYALERATPLHFHRILKPLLNGAQHF